MNKVAKNVIWTVVGAVAFIGGLDAFFKMRDNQFAYELERGISLIASVDPTKEAKLDVPEHLIAIRSEEDLKKFEGAENKSAFQVLSTRYMGTKEDHTSRPIISFKNNIGTDPVTEVADKISPAEMRAKRDEFKNLMLAQATAKNTPSEAFVMQENALNFSVDFAKALRQYANTKEMRKRFRDGTSLYTVFQGLSEQDFRNVLVLVMDNRVAKLAKKQQTETKDYEALTAKVVQDYYMPIEITSGILFW